MTNRFISSGINFVHGGLSGWFFAYSMYIQEYILGVAILILGVLFVVGRTYARNETLDLVKEEFGVTE